MNIWQNKPSAITNNLFSPLQELNALVLMKLIFITCYYQYPFLRPWQKHIGYGLV